MQRTFAPPGRGRSVAGALALGLALAACGAGTDSSGAPSSFAAPQAGNGATPSSATPPPPPGDSATSVAAGGSAATKTPADPNAPRLDPGALRGQAVTIDGTSFDLGSLAGKDLVVWFWAPW
ncbi:MAG: hypothetical protein OEY41_02750 [Acidimicrobiia bacterium]|nr:hypothetical protein [Acidimicrobiia bacterium]MDH5288897.1 hypothetical protein [Acidimicrobiia bacterium]